MYELLTWLHLITLLVVTLEREELLRGKERKEKKRYFYKHRRELHLKKKDDLLKFDGFIKCDTVQ